MLRKREGVRTLAALKKNLKKLSRKELRKLQRQVKVVVQVKKNHNQIPIPIETFSTKQVPIPNFAFNEQNKPKESVCLIPLLLLMGCSCSMYPTKSKNSSPSSKIRIACQRNWRKLK